MKKIIVTTLQIAVTVFALYVVFRKPGSFTGTVNVVRQADPLWLLAALLAGTLSPITATIRWWMLMRVQKVGIGIGRVAQIYMIGAFYNLILPGSTGGDAVKLFYILRGSDPRKRAGIILSVIMDRLLGLLALIIMATILVCLRYHWLTQTAATSNLVNSFATVLGLAAAGLVLVFIVIKARLVERLPAKTPARSKLIELAAAVEVYTRAWPTFLAGIAISFVGHSSFIFTYYFAARAIAAAVRLYDMAVLLPIVNTIVSLPISVSGVGVRESLFKTLLKDLCGVGENYAVSISVIGFLCTVIFIGLLGGIVNVLYRAHEGPLPAHVGDVEAQVEADEMPNIEGQLHRPPGTTDA